jgi:predicted component of viral defense system (DUF524 family)
MTKVLRRGPDLSRFRFGSFGSHLPNGYTADFGVARVTFNRSFSKPQSYSVPLRPDITLELQDALHLFDAKLKRDFIPASTSDAVLEEEEQRATYRRGDLYKMHTYRDALGAQSVWILFPGRNVGRVHFQPTDPQSVVGPCGVGALPLLPGDVSDREQLVSVMEAMLGKGVAETDAA